MGSLRIVLTRPASGAGPLEDGLEQAGLVPAHLPLTRQAPPEDGSRLTEGIDRLAAGECDWLLLTSGNTVRFLLEAGWAGAVPPGTRVGAVGPGTAQALARLTEIDRPWVPALHSAQGILDEFGQAGAANRIFLPQSAQARPLLADGLLSRGWQVVSAPAYKTVPVQGPLPWRPEAEDVVLVTASSAAHEWVRRGLSARAVLAIGEPTARSLRELGAPADAVLAEPTAAGVLAAVESLG